MKGNIYLNIIKPAIDFLLSLLFLIILSPVFFIVLVLLSIVNSGKPFFFHERPGKDERIFKVIKFKTMTDKKDSNGKLLPDNERITKVGAFIRKTSLDEIPQLINVLMGDMSLVGPRPLLVRYLDLYSDDQKRRHWVKPGITGLAQVSGRNSIPWKRKFELDIQYVDNLSFNLDAKIIMHTINKVIKREGVNQTSERPMQPFNGQN
jgi:lipopolysaccharide/colanic/teichoic acid biosynthesis glycosyltransferase